MSRVRNARPYLPTPSDPSAASLIASVRGAAEAQERLHSADRIDAFTALVARAPKRRQTPIPSPPGGR